MSILSSITSVVSGGSSTVIKYAAIAGAVLALAVGSFFYGNHVGSLAEKNAVLAQAAKQQQKTITIVQKQTVVDTTAVAALQKKVDQLAGTNAKLKSQINGLATSALTVITLPTKIQPDATCSLSSDFVKLYNQSIGVSK